MLPGAHAAPLPDRRAGRGAGGIRRVRRARARAGRQGHGEGRLGARGNRGAQGHGAFLVLENPGTVARSVVSGTADVAEKLELHEMVRDGTMMKMSPVKSIEIPAGGKTELKPGGLHLMLFGLKRPLAAGDSIHVTLTLDDGSTVMLMAGVRKPGAMP
ncbi:MAG: copper chaperone PCu(A)C [Gemmatimonadetes bacterium]|nr:copper chaperone PCu(A)C [Gemmatimonadota bacterium]